MSFHLAETPRPARHPLPDYSFPGRPVFEGRIGKLLERMQAEQLDVLFIYGDREHYGNLAWACGYDPRFEEGALALFRDGRQALLVGNEGVSYAAICPMQPEIVLCQSFSLLSQARDTAPSLKDCLRQIGLRDGQRIGAIGWKYFLDTETEDPQHTLDLPSFIADALRDLAGHDNVTNQTAMTMDPGDGLRIFVEAEQILAFEACSQRASLGILDAITLLKPGMQEVDIAKAFGHDGRPLNYHPVVLSGERTALGLASASSKQVERGDPIFMAIGGWGANSVRAGYVVEKESELSRIDPDYIDAVIAPYMEMVAAWYETVSVSANAGAVHKAVMDNLGGRIERPALNPGHHIHVDEWVSSPFFENSEIELKSGMMMQMDIIPVVQNGGFGANAEDGIVLADAELRGQLQRMEPQFMQRVENRRNYMKEQIGIALDESVLPLSDIQGWVPPLLLNPGLAMRRV